MREVGRVQVGAAARTRRIDRYTPAAAKVERAAEDPRVPADRVTLSPEARRELTTPGAAAGTGDAGEQGQAGGLAGGLASGSAARKLTEAQQRQVRELQQRDAHVRQHEAAHEAAGGDLTGQASFSYETGPDGRSYAVGGEVALAARSGRTPDETIAIARRVKAAALAPADPSSADLAAAAQATQVELQAAQQKRQQAGAIGKPASPTTPGGRSSLPQLSLERLVVRSPEPFL